MIELIKGDCLVEMQNIPDKSIDCIICDLPYGTTACKWDTVIPFEPLWAQYKRIIKDNGAIVLFGSQPFTSALVMSNPKMFRYEWIWEKEQGINFLFSKKQPMKVHENVCVFYKAQPKYNPIMAIGSPYTSGAGKSGETLKGYAEKVVTENKGERFPRTVQFFKRETKSLHPTQKPLPLLEYLIKTYTNENEVVLDNTMGSGTAGVAAVNLNRNFIGIEMDEAYFEIASKRINEAQTDLKLKL